jgi:hypothetical protein
MSPLVATAVDFSRTTWQVFAEMAPYLLLGFAVAGAMHVLIPTRLIERHLGGRGFWPAFKAALCGIPLPLCSCSVIPVTAALRKHGASRGATVGFLLSTPQSGADSILVTWSLLGPLIALYRPLVALTMGALGGWAVDAATGKDGELNGSERVDHGPCQDECCAPGNGRQANRAAHAQAGSHCADELSGDACGCESVPVRPPSPIARALRYGFMTLPRDIGKPLLLGMLVAGALSVVVPVHFLAPYLGGGILPMLVMMLVGIPMYVCATASVPVAAALIGAGLSPGAALVFLISGPVTNAAEIGALWKVLGRKAVLVYLGAVALGALAAGLALDAFLARTGWRVEPLAIPPAMEQASLISAVVMLAVFAYALWPRRVQLGWRRSQAASDLEEMVMDAGKQHMTLAVKGMTCSGCANSVTRALRQQPGVEEVQVDLESGKAFVSGSTLQVAGLVTAVERLGYTAAPVDA